MDDVVQFKSIPAFFNKERDGSKCCTVRKIQGEDPREELLCEFASGLNKDLQIEIFCTSNPCLSFKREITDVSFWEGLTIISWRHQ